MKVSGLVTCGRSEGGQCAAGATDPGTLLPASTGTAETKDRSYSTVHIDQKLVVIDWPENPDFGVWLCGSTRSRKATNARQQ